jgi:hypothetical protein
MGVSATTTMTLLTEFGTKKGIRIGDHKIEAVTLVRNDKFHTLICLAERGRKVAGTLWRVVPRLYPDQFNRNVPLARCHQQASCVAIRPAASRDQADQCPAAAIAAGRAGRPLCPRKCSPTG